MPEQLTQSQIDALLNKMSSGEVEVDEPTQKVKEYDFTSPKMFTKEQLKALDGLHETFSRMLSSYLSGMLRLVCEVEVLQIEELDFYEYSNALPDSALIGVLDFLPEEERYSDTTMLMDMSISLGFFLIERLLGGVGSGLELSRDFTEIELAILQNVFEKITGRLKDAWTLNLTSDIRLGSVETNSRLLQVFAPEDIVVVVVLAIHVGKMTGNLSICMSGESLEEFIDRFTVKYARAGSKRPDQEKEQMQKRLILENIVESDMELRAVFDEFTMELQDVMQLQEADVIPLGKDIGDDISMWLDGIPWFTAKLGETKGKKSVKLNHPVN